jgi:purine-binding chemotaxis protein CheW
MSTEFAAAPAQRVSREARATAGMYLTFQLDREVYGLEILKVQEIIAMLPVTQVPRMPAHVRGVVNLRGRVIPLVDLRRKFGMAAREDDDRTCIIVVQLEQDATTLTMGVIVDAVAEVVDVTAAQIEPPPSLGASVDTDFILGMAKVDENVALLLDIEQVLGGLRGACAAEVNG